MTASTPEPPPQTSFSDLVDRVRDGLVKEGGGTFVIAFTPVEDENKTWSDRTEAYWTVGTDFGEEAPASDKPGGASYATGPDLRACVVDVLEETGW